MTLSVPCCPDSLVFVVHILHRLAEQRGDVRQPGGGHPGGASSDMLHASVHQTHPGETICEYTAKIRQLPAAAASPSDDSGAVAFQLLW